MNLNNFKLKTFSYVHRALEKQKEQALMKSRISPEQVHLLYNVEKEVLKPKTL